MRPPDLSTKISARVVQILPANATYVVNTCYNHSIDKIFMVCSIWIKKVFFHWVFIFFIRYC